MFTVFHGPKLPQRTYRRKSQIRPVCLRLDQSVQEPSALSSQSCQASDCHCIKMFHRLDQICELQWQSEERQIWLPMAGGSCTGWSNLRSIGPINEVYRYIPLVVFLCFISSLVQIMLALWKTGFSLREPVKTCKRVPNSRVLQENS